MKFLVTGSAGFIGFSLCKKLLERGDIVIGIDYHNDYYDPKIKEARLKKILIKKNYQHYKIDISDEKKLSEIFKSTKPDKVINLAAQAGVRYSMENPLAYINSNIVGLDIKPELPKNSDIIIKNDFNTSVEKLSDKLIESLKKKLKWKA